MMVDLKQGDNPIPLTAQNQARGTCMQLLNINYNMHVNLLI